MLSSLRKEVNLLFQSDSFLVRISDTSLTLLHNVGVQPGLGKAAPSCLLPALLFTTLWKAAVLVSFRRTKLWFSCRGSVCHLISELERDNPAGEHRARLNLV